MLIVVLHILPCSQCVNYNCHDLQLTAKSVGLKFEKEEKYSVFFPEKHISVTELFHRF
jgi:hypothetical protein